MSRLEAQRTHKLSLLPEQVRRLIVVQILTVGPDQLPLLGRRLVSLLRLSGSGRHCHSLRMHYALLLHDLVGARSLGWLVAGGSSQLV